MNPAGIFSVISGAAALASPIIDWAATSGAARRNGKRDIQKACLVYKAENKLNCAVLSHINLDKINTRDIGDPAVKNIAGSLKTEAAEELLLSLFSLIQKPDKAVKAMSGKTLSKTEKAEAKKLITAIISTLEKTKELRCFTSLNEAGQMALKGFYVRARLKHLKEKSLYIKMHL